MPNQSVSKWSSRPTDGRSNAAQWIAPPEDAAPLMVGSLRCGWEWEDTLGQFCLLTDVVAGAGRPSRTDQTAIVFDQLEALLDRAGYLFHQVVRTWFLLDDILSWYDDFNRVRTKFYSERGLLGRSPASTAVGVNGNQRSAITAQLLAWRPGNSGATAAVARSPFQGSAFDYGSAFSRGAVIEHPRGKRLYVSGTASIDACGNTVHSDNSERQIAETFRVVGAMLECHGLAFADVAHAQGYVSRETDVNLVRAAMSQHLNADVPLMRADICRRELRFEIELMAERFELPSRISNRT